MLKICIVNMRQCYIYSFRLDYQHHVLCKSFLFSVDWQTATSTLMLLVSFKCICTHLNAFHFEHIASVFVYASMSWPFYYVYVYHCSPNSSIQLNCGYKEHGSQEEAEEKSDINCRIRTQSSLSLFLKKVTVYTGLLLLCYAINRNRGWVRVKGMEKAARDRG